MMNHKVFYIVIAIIITKVGTNNDFICQNDSHCSCTKHSRRKFNIICSADSLIKKDSSSIETPAFFNISINLNKKLIIECINSPSWSNFGFGNLSSLNSSVIEDLYLIQCLPPGSQDSQRFASIFGTYGYLEIYFNHSTSTIPFLEELNWYAIDEITLTLEFTKDLNDLSSDIFQGNKNA